MAITLKKLTLAQAEKQFPGCITEEIKELQEVNKLEAGYHELGSLDGKLLSSCYEIAYLSWSIWQDGEWQDLDHADYALLERLNEEDSISWR